ncbi:hypothetical protein D3C76_911930 [compost metagenome]
MECLPLRQIQVIVRVPALLQLVDAPRHNVAAWPGTAFHQGKDSGCLNTDLALRLRRKTVTAPDVARHDRQAWIAGGRVLHTPAQVSPGGVVAGLIVDPARPVLVEFANPGFGAHWIRQDHACGEALGVQRSAVVDLLDDRPGTRRVHIPVLEHVVRRDLVNLPFPANTAKAVGVGD